MRHTRSPRNHRRTSAAALDSIQPHLSALQAKVYRTVLASRSRGLTRQEIERRAKMDGSTVRPRCVELIERKLLVPSGEERCTRSGHKAEVLIARVPVIAWRLS